MRLAVTARTVVAGVVGAPIRHSLSPLIHNAWLEAGDIDGIYVAFAPPAEGFAAFVEGLRGGAIRGLNVTAPFKAQALAAADRVSPTARAAGSANLLIFETDGEILADSTDGAGLLGAIAEQAPDFEVGGGPAVILGAGGAAEAAGAALIAAGAPEVRLMNRTPARARLAARRLGSRARPLSADRAALEEGFEGARLLVNALPAGASIDVPLERLASGAAVMDMTYRPLETPLLAVARARGLAVIDGLAMLIAQARPSFAALFRVDAPAHVDVRALAAAAC